MTRAITAALFTLFLATAGEALAATAEQCKALSEMDFGRIQDAPTKLMTSAVVAAAGGVPAYCRAEGFAAPQVGLEVKLPLENWNGKFLFQGCGAMCGSMMGSAACDDGVARGYACATTDMGHKSPNAQDGKWAYNNPVAEIDVGHRATHVATVAGKAITAAFYSGDLKQSYYRGCSTGGRQALVEAQRYPYDFDGIIGGSPVLYQLMGPPLQLIWAATANFDANGKEIMDAEKIPAIHKAAVASCDALDGVTDGVIDDPRQCKFDPASMKCTSAPNAQCLTDAEVNVARKIYTGPKPTGKQSFAPLGLLPGSELGWIGYIKGGKKSPNYSFASEMLRYLAFSEDPGPNYDPLEFDWARDPQRMSLSALSGANPDMSLFKKGGGKLILFHGLADPAIMATSTMAFYDTVTRTMDGLKETQDFARLYLPPGLNHCTGGAGINTVDFLGALEAWVERGQAPEGLSGYHVTAVQTNAALPIGFKPADAEFARPVYPYPDRAVYDGSGDWKDAANFKRNKGR
ncbi:MAG: tannase/feruloyl esterase family alpha/beta hydrolase [Rhodospirillaceae bacterium]|nr:tannase/feruloyl esterase family alpha/beta hydrolase [Rhodospirillaceae bacterium]